MPGARRRGRPRTAWIDNIKSWTGLSVEESIRMTEDRYGKSTSMVWPISDRGRLRNRTEVCSWFECLLYEDKRLDAFNALVLVT